MGLSGLQEGFLQHEQSAFWQLFYMFYAKFPLYPLNDLNGFGFFFNMATLEIQVELLVLHISCQKLY